MRRFCITLIALFLIATFISAVYADEAVKAAKASFKKVREAYILAKEELSDAQIGSLFTVGEAEKQEAKKRIWRAQKQLRAAKKAYVAALNELHEAETARDAKIDRSPWK